jgi:hypothetical protein
MNINHCMMLKYYGFLDCNDVTLSGILSSFAKVDETHSLVGTRILNENKGILLNLVKSKLMLCKKQGIYYFNRFNERLTNCLETSQLMNDIGIATKINFENNTNQLIFFLQFSCTYTKTK